MASLAQKDVTQATIVRKLSSYTRQNQTKKALWELDNLCRTLYILEFIDDVGLRRSVQKALNHGEAYHRLRRAIAYVNSGKFRVQTEAEQQIWNECSRLIANAIVHYNTALLLRVYEQKRAAGDHEAMTMIAGMSPVAWQHINLFGSFELSPADSSVDIEALAAFYAGPNWWSRILRETADPTMLTQTVPPEASLGRGYRKISNFRGIDKNSHLCVKRFQVHRRLTDGRAGRAEHIRRSIL